jgi:hypothetical protein
MQRTRRFATLSSKSWQALTPVEVIFFSQLDSKITVSTVQTLCIGQAKIMGQWRLRWKHTVILLLCLDDHKNSTKQTKL